MFLRIKQLNGACCHLGTIFHLHFLFSTVNPAIHKRGPKYFVENSVLTKGVGNVFWLQLELEQVNQEPLSRSVNCLFCVCVCSVSGIVNGNSKKTLFLRACVPNPRRTYDTSKRRTKSWGSVEVKARAFRVQWLTPRPRF